MAEVQRRRVWIHILVLILYTALALILTWPLVRHLTSHVPGSYTWAFDEYTFLWNTWWFRYSLFNLEQSPLYSTYTFYPLGISLVFYTYNLFNALISIPLQAFLPIPAISNLTFLFATIFSAYGTFLLVEYLLRRRELPQRDPAPASKTRSTRPQSPIGSWPTWAPAVAIAAFTGGLIYAYGSYRMVYAAIGHHNQWSTTWIPFYALYLLKTIHEPRLRNPVLAGLFLVLALLNEMLWGVFLAMLTLILLAFSAGRQGRADVSGGWPALWKRLVVVAIVAVVLYLPVLVPIVGEIFSEYELVGWGDAEKLSSDLVGLVTPTALHPLGGDWTETLRQTREGTSQFRDVNTVFLGWIGLALALVGALRYRREIAAWITSALLFTVFSLGPLLQINGRSHFDLDGLIVNVPLPFILLHYIPVVKANRTPNRFSVVLMLALAVLAGFGVYWLLRKLARSERGAARVLLAACALVLGALLIFEHWSVPLPMTDARIPPVYEKVRADAGSTGAAGSILQLPMGWRNGFGVQGAENTQTQYFQSYHHRPLLSGNTSRNPPLKFDYFQRIPILDSLITIQTYGQVDAERRAADRATAGDLVSFYDIRYVVVAPGVPGRPPYVDTRDAAVAYVEEVLPLTKVYERDGWLLYEVNQPPLPAAMTIDLGSPAPARLMALGQGWAEAEQIQGASAQWAVDQAAEVFLPAVPERGYRLSMTALPFDYPGAGEQGLTPEINGHRLQRAPMSSGWQTYVWDVPGTLLRPGLNELYLRFDRLAAPADVLPGNGAIGTTGIRAPVAIEVNSGGPDDFAFITVASGEATEDGSVHRPGYNLAVVDAQTGELLDRRGFDTTPGGAETEAADLARFVAGIADGQIVIAALQGDGTAKLSDEALAALHAIGGQVDPRGTSGWSHAIVGVKGAPPGTALEAAGPGEGWLRAAPDERTLAIAVDAIAWEQLGP